MKNRKIMNLRFKEACLKCNREYRRMIKQVYRYVKRHFVLDEKICNMMQDIWDLLVDYSSQNAKIGEVIPNPENFILDAFCNEIEKVPSKWEVILKTIVFLVIIPSIIGLIVFLIVK